MSPTAASVIQNVDLELLLHMDRILSGPKEVKEEGSRGLSRDDQVVTCLRSLAMDAVQQAKSGHPGTPMAMAPVAYALWARVLRYDPEDPTWMNRDRFVLSMGHASALLYGILHLAGVKDVGPDGLPCRSDSPPGLAVTLEDIKGLRQDGSRCPGHPEYRWTAGVEVTTGPLGQGVSSSVGMAIASKWYAATFNKPGLELFDYDVYALGGDGCIQEGVAQEAASLAGHLKLDNLCWIWDNNQISIEGDTSLAISEDVTTRFIACGWNVLRVGDANDLDSLTRAFQAFKREKHRPTLIVVDSHIAWGAPTVQDSAKAHGNPLGDAEISATKGIYGWPDEKFLVPQRVLKHFRSQVSERGGMAHKAWQATLAQYEAECPKEAESLAHINRGTLPEGWDSRCKCFPADATGLATRQSSAKCLNMVAEGMPWMMGGSADLGPSCLTTLTFEGAGDFFPPSTGLGTHAGRNLHFGIREHAMGAIVNGLAVSKLRPFGSTFLVFSDYMKAPIRLSAIMEVPCTWVFTHDSIAVGEDGPTHQPVEQLSALRSIPRLLTFRPGDANEVLEMWKHIAQLQHEPAAVVLSRQAMPTLDRREFAPATGLHSGAYVLAGDAVEPDVILMASGSEVALMLEAHRVLESKGVVVRSVSMPCMELFKQQPSEYRLSVLPDQCRARVSVEAATMDSWGCFIGLDGEHVGVSTFGASKPGKRLQEEMGLTVEGVVASAGRSMQTVAKQSKAASSY